MPILNLFLSAIAEHGTSKGEFGSRAVAWGVAAGVPPVRRWSGPGVADVCDFGIRYELCENTCMQKKLKLVPPHSGVHVVRVAPLGPSADVVKPSDVVMAINGHKIANDGTIAFRQDERVSLQHLVSSLSLFQECQLELLRDGQPLTVTVGRSPASA